MDIFTDFFSSYGVIGRAFYHFWWIALPVTFFYIFKVIWMDFVIDKSKFSWLNGLEWTLLEIIPPSDIERSPKMIESLYAGMAGVLTTYSNFEVYLKGAITDRFSVELVGEEGDIHFYIRTLKKYRNLIEGQVYAQYPGAEIIEVPDYVQKFPKVIPNKDWNLWGSDFIFNMDDPYPIRTYDKFEEDITGTIIDPMAALTEVLNGLTPGQHIWLQFVIEPLHEGWSAKQKALIQKLAGRDAPSEKGFFGHLIEVFTHLFAAVKGPVEFPTTAKKEQQPLEFRLTPLEKDILKSVESNLGMNSFKTKMRMVYLGRRENFHKPFVSAFVGAIKQFNDLNMNQVKPDNASKTYANYLFKDERLLHRQRKVYKRYRFRSMDGNNIVLSMKELATLFHFPDMNVKTPSVTRVDSKRGTAPANLPIA